MLPVVLPLADVAIGTIDHTTVTVPLVAPELALVETVRADLLANALGYSLLVQLRNDLRDFLRLAEVKLLIRDWLHLNVRLARLRPRRPLLQEFLHVINRERSQLRPLLPQVIRNLVAGASFLGWHRLHQIANLDLFLRRALFNMRQPELVLRQAALVVFEHIQGLPAGAQPPRLGRLR